MLLTTALFPITFPKRKEILERLIGVDKNPFLVKNFYPFLLEWSGKTYELPQIVALIVLARLQYIDTIELNDKEKIIEACNLDLKKYIKVFVLDEYFQDEAISIYESIPKIVPPSL